MQGPDGGFHTGYDRDGTYAGTLENAQTTSIVILALQAVPPFSPITLPPIPFILLIAACTIAGCAVVAVVAVISLETKSKKTGPGLSGCTNKPYLRSLSNTLLFTHKIRS